MGRICWFRCYSPQCLHRPAHFTCTRLCIPFIPWFDLPFLPQGITQWNRVRCSCGRRPLMMILVVKPSLTQTPEFAAQFRPCLRKPEDDQQLYHKTIRVIIPMLMGRHQCSATWFFSTWLSGRWNWLDLKLGTSDFCYRKLAFLDSFLKNGVATNGPLWALGGW